MKAITIDTTNNQKDAPTSDSFTATEATALIKALQRPHPKMLFARSPLQPLDDPLTENARYRQSFMDFARRGRFTHWLTLNTHRDCSISTATQRLKRWRVEVMRHVHGYRFYEKPQDELFWYLGCPELSLAGHPHFHLAVSVPEQAVKKFEVKAPYRWLDLMPSGTCDLQVIGSADADQRRVLGYAAKWLDPKSDVPFVDSRIYR